MNNIFNFELWCRKMAGVDAGAKNWKFPLGLLISWSASFLLSADSKQTKAGPRNLERIFPFLEFRQKFIIPTLSGLESLKDITLITQNWLFSKLFALIFDHLKFAKENYYSYRFFAKIRYYDFLDVIIWL